MNEALKSDNIEKFFDEIGKPVKNNYLYAYEEPSNTSIFLLGVLSVIDMTYYIVGFFPEEIILLPLTVTGKFRGDHVIIPREKIHNMDVKKGLMQYKITIKKDNQKSVLKCNKFILNTPWQKENIQFLEKKYW